MYIPAAIHLYLGTSDPTLLDSVRGAGQRRRGRIHMERARAYIRLTPYRNSSTHRVHEFDLSEPTEYP